MTSDLPDMLDSDDLEFYIIGGGSSEARYRQATGQTNPLFRKIWLKYFDNRPERLLKTASEMRDKLEAGSVIQLSRLFVHNSPTFAGVLCQLQVWSLSGFETSC